MSDKSALLTMAQNASRQGNNTYIIIERISDGKKALLDENDDIPPGYTVPIRRYQLTPYDAEGKIKTMYKNLQVLHSGHVEKPAFSSKYVTGVWTPDIRFVVIQHIKSKDIFLLEHTKPIPIGFMRILKHLGKNCHFDGELSSACKKLPVLIS